HKAVPGCTLLTPELQAFALKPQLPRATSPAALCKTEQTNRQIRSAEYSFHFLGTASSLFSGDRIWMKRNAVGLHGQHLHFRRCERRSEHPSMRGRRQAQSRRHL
ncbi:hypothetical protein, partial [Rhizobium anhuiense]|uniref:hypothetical protein n=2 Tax=Rhizobium anhuiense TaxID=1184720 RepID=UPI001AED0327